MPTREDYTGITVTKQTRYRLLGYCNERGTKEKPLTYNDSINNLIDFWEENY